MHIEQPGNILLGTKIQPSPSYVFNPGKLFITPSAMAAVSRIGVYRGLLRHLRGDWGDVVAADKDANDEALFQGNSLLSMYQDHKRVKFLIITEASRAYTTVLLPEEY